MALNSIPLELTQIVAGYLEDDHDICNFRLICSNTRNAVDADSGSFWRKRFKASFDPVLRPANNEDLKEEYQRRRKVIRRGINIRSGRSSAEVEYLKILRDLVVECCSGATDKDGYPTCRNEHWIRHVVYSTNLLHEVFIPKRARTAPHQLMVALQLVLAHHSLDQCLQLDTFGFPDSQQAVYASVAAAPIFVGFNKLSVNLVWVLHVLNFFKYHMTRQSEQTLFEQFGALEEWEKPQAWKSQLKEGAHKLGKFWKGTYAYIERYEMDKIRSSTGPESEVIIDQNVNNPYKAIQTLRLSFPSGNEAPWPDKFEKYLNSLPKHLNAKTRAQHRAGAPPVDDSVSFRFNGRGYDDEDFYSSGWLNPLPPQQGIPGWQRMTMMKYFVDEDGHWDDEALWAYEGVVFPGGQIMLGRWWSPEDHTRPEQASLKVYSGPFIFWNMNGADEELEEEYDFLAMEEGDTDNGISHFV